jgi:hypothetical protein
VRTGPKRARRSDYIVAWWVSWTGFVRQLSLRTEGLYNLSKIPWEFAIVQCPGVILSLLIVSCPLWFSVDQISFRFVQLAATIRPESGRNVSHSPANRRWNPSAGSESPSATTDRPFRSDRHRDTVDGGLIITPNIIVHKYDTATQ